MKKIKYLIFLAFFPLFLIAQVDTVDSFVQFSGSLSLSYDAYNYSTLNYSSFRPRYDDDIFRVSANASVKFGKYISIPFGLNLSTQNYSYNLPSLPEENLIDYVKTPRNNIHIDPTYKWIKAHIGSHSPQYSQLTTGDIQVFGAGLDMNPGKFILSANYGISQYAFEPDSILNIQGAYKQELVAGRIGFGRSEGAKFALNFVKIKDDVTSVVEKPIGINPIEGITLSPLIEIKLFEKIIIKTETAASVFTNNLYSSPIPSGEELTDLLSDYVAVNLSSQIDMSHVSLIEWRSESFSLGGELKYIGPGFMPAGYRFMEKDIIDYKVNSGFRLFKNKVNLNGTFGIRTNNIKSTNLESTQRIIGNASLMLQLNKALNINFNYSNFGMSNDQDLSTIRIQIVQNSYSLAPSYQFKTKAANHVISANASKNEFQQFNAIANDFVNTNSENYTANYIMVFNAIPLNISLSTLSLVSSSEVGTLEMMNYQFSANYKMFNKKLEPSLALVLANIKMEEYTADNRFSARLKVQYKVSKKLNVRLSYLFKKYNYGSSKIGAVLNENKLQCSLSMKF